MKTRTLRDLANLADVACPERNSAGAAFLFDIAADASQRVEELSSRIHADEIISIVETALCIPDSALWDVLHDLALWLPEEADMAWLESALTEVGLRLAAALVAEAVASRCEFVV